MKLTGFALAALIVSLGVAEAQTGKPEQALMGTWNCTAESNGAIIKGPYTFLAGGKAKMESTISVPAAELESAGAGNGTWKLLPDGKLEETITDFKVATSKVSGQATTTDDMQAMVDAMVVNVPTALTMKLDAKSLVLTDAMGQVTSCTR